jgi:hypothetical protein
MLSPNERKNRGGADTEAKDHMGYTPLHFLISHGNLVIVKALLVVGADIDYGELPTHRAVNERQLAVSKYLLRQFYATICRLPLLYTDSWKTSRGLAVVLHHFVLRFTGMHWVRMMSWRWLSTGRTKPYIAQFSRPRRLIAYPPSLSSWCLFHYCSVSGESLWRLH